MTVAAKPRSLNLLLIEDNPRDVQLIRYVLEDIKDVRINLEDAPRLADGLERLARGGIDIVLLDLSLPDSPWEETFAKVRAAAADLPVVVLTGMTNPSLPPQLIRAGAQDYLVKGETDGKSFLHSILFAIERHKLQDREAGRRTEDREALAQMEKLVKFDRMISATHDPEELVRIAGKILPGLFHAGAFSLYFYDPERTSLRRAFQSPAPRPEEEDESLMWTVVNTREPIFFTRGDRSAPDGPRDENGFICLPLLAKGKVLGVANFGRLSLEGVSPANIASLKRTAGHLALALHNSVLARELEETAARDPLTKLFNRHHLFKELSEALARSQENGIPFCLLMVDADGFKRINDSRGHLAGDRAIRDLADRIRSFLRPGDAAFRFGGDEFVILLPDTKAERAAIFAEDLRKGLAQNGAEAGAGLTVSIGFTQNVAGEDAETLLKRADAALYEAKGRGRDRCVRL